MRNVFSYVFERGYVNYDAYDSYSERGIQFVTHPLITFCLRMLTKGVEYTDDTQYKCTNRLFIRHY